MNGMLPGAAAAALTGSDDTVGEQPRPVLPVGLAAAVAAAVDASIAENTKAAYASDWVRFTRWCAAGGHGELPADPVVVAGYLVDAASMIRPDGAPAYAPSTLARWTASINARHTAAGHPAPGRTELVRRSLAGIRATAARPQRRARPMRLGHLEDIVAAARLRASQGAFRAQVAERRNTTILLLGQFGAFRESELAALLVDDVTFDTHDGLTITVRKSKADQQAHGQVKAIPPYSLIDLCSPCAYLRWRQLVDAHDAGGPAAAIRILRGHKAPPAEHICGQEPDPAPEGLSARRPLLRPLTQNGWIADRHMSRERVRGAVIAERERAGLPTAGFSGHSLRAGFVTEGFAAGAAPHEMVVQTGHTSYATLERYRRDSPLVGNAVNRLDNQKRRK